MPEIAIGPKEIGRAIKARREELGLTGDEVVARSGVKRSTYFRLEQGSGKTINFSRIKAIANALDMDSSMFMGAVKEDVSGYSKAFRDQLEEIILGCDLAGLNESGVDLQFIRDIIDGSAPLSFESACEIADQVGMSLDEIMEKKDPALMAESEVESEIIQLLSKLSPEKLRAAATYIRFLTESGDM